MSELPTPSHYKRIDWHDDALKYAERNGLEREDCEAILLSKSNPKVDDRSNKVGHLIVRYRVGDVVIVVGHRDLEVPVIMSVWVDDHGAKKKAPKKRENPPRTLKEMSKRIIEAGYQLEHGGKHVKVVDPDTGRMLMTLPSSPNEYRSLLNSWSLFRRRHAENQSDKERTNGG